MTGKEFLEQHPEIEDDFYDFLAPILEEYGKKVFEVAKREMLYNCSCYSHYPGFLEKVVRAMEFESSILGESEGKIES